MSGRTISAIATGWYSDLTCCMLLLVALSIRACVGLAGYSGEHTPPMYGDFEAQRHWMELTINLPPSAWYVQGPDNDLQYWGLDYPPLSAHLSWLLGKLARAFGHSALVELHASRGHESPATRAFMRNTVLACDALIFMTAAAAFAHAAAKQPPSRARAISSVGAAAPLLLAPGTNTLLMQIVLVPALVLVDHGHFQYNCVSLGLTLWAFYFAMNGQPLRCSACFSLALNFKQMTLYLAPAVFCYLLAGCLRRGSTRLLQLAHVARLGVVVLLTFGLCWLPWLLPLPSTSSSPGDARGAGALAVLRRVFPVERHLYEDKVANLWCTLALLPFLKLKQLLSIAALLRLALVTTLLAVLPPCALLLRSPSRLGFLLCAAACGLAFFLCSFQVHEKHILLPLLPLSLLAHRIPALFGWFSAVSCFSLFPLLKRDGLILPYAVLQLAYLSLSLALAPSNDTNTADADGSPAQPLPLPTYARVLMALSVVGMLVLHAAEALIVPPSRYPDIHAVAFGAFSCAHFCLAYVAAVGTQWLAARSAASQDEHTPMDGVAPEPTPQGVRLSLVFPGDETRIANRPKRA